MAEGGDALRAMMCATQIPSARAWESSSLRVCIATTQLGAYSETFIANHIERLPAQVTVIHGLRLECDADCGPIDVPTRWTRLQRRFGGRFLGRTQEQYKIAATANYLISRGIQVVLAEYGPVGLRALPICEAVGLPLVVHFHGYDAFSDTALTQHREAYRAMFRKAAATIGVSRDMHAQLIALGSPPEKTFYLPYGVDVDRFAQAAPEKAPPHFLAVGRFVEKKAPHLTVLAFSRVVQQFPDARLFMIGDGPLRGPTQQLARALGIEHAVEFLGIQDQESVANWMRCVRALVQHSIRAINGDSEGTPLAVLEAQASGLPVIATRHMGIKDVVLDGQTGYLVDEQDVTGVTEAIIRLIRRPEEARHLGQAGRRRVESHFQSESQLKKLTVLLDWAVSSQKPCAGPLGGSHQDTFQV